MYIIDGSTAVGVMDGVSSAVRAERLECGVLRVRDLNRPKRIRCALRAGQTAPICHNSDTNGAVAFACGWLRLVNYTSVKQRRDAVWRNDMTSCSADSWASAAGR